MIHTGKSPVCIFKQNLGVSIMTINIDRVTKINKTRKFINKLVPLIQTALLEEYKLTDDNFLYKKDKNRIEAIIESLARPNWMQHPSLEFTSNSIHLSVKMHYVERYHNGIDGSYTCGYDTEYLLIFKDTEGYKCGKTDYNLLPVQGAKINIVSLVKVQKAERDILAKIEKAEKLKDEIQAIYHNVCSFMPRPRNY